MKRQKKKRRLIKIVPILVILGVICGIGVCLYAISPVSTKDDKVLFKVKQGESTTSIINDLRKNNLIKSRKVAIVFIKINNIDTIKAGNYELNRNMSMRKIFEIITDSKNIKEDTITLTFNEGKNMRGIAKIITDNTNISENDIYNLLEDKEYLKSLMDDYWFLTEDILDKNIYYPLEGYLYPDTYEFSKDVTIKDIFKKMLDREEEILDKYKNSIDSSSLSIHKTITMASITELEGKNIEDRKNIVGVFFNRINNNLPLGSDVTTYYAAKVDMGERDLYQAEIDASNAYNTRPMSSAGRLPVGPICNPSEDAINAVINYTKNDYFYFVADKNGKVYFSKTDAEHTSTIQKLKDQGLWFTY